MQTGIVEIFLIVVSIENTTKKIWNLASGLVQHWNRWQKNITCQRKQ